MKRTKKTFFSSDWHLSHQNVIKYDCRPFNNVDEMNTVILNNYNELVKNGDDFFFMGDFAFNQIDAEEFLKQMNGNLHFIKGNHDHKPIVRLYEKYGNYLGEQRLVKVNNQEIVLNHYSMRVWNKSHHGVWHLYGHSHGSLPDDPHSFSFDVGCMLHDYKPLEFEEVKEIMSKKNYKPKDHHR